MPQIVLRPEGIVANINEGWTSPEHVFHDDGVVAAFTESTEENGLTLTLGDTGLPLTYTINSVRIGLDGLTVISKTPAEGTLGVKMMKGSTSGVYYNEGTTFNNNAIGYLQTLRTEASSGTPWTVSSINGIRLILNVVEEESTLPINLDQVYLTVDYNLPSSPIKITSGVVKITSGKIII
tara:strand:- start:3608 stop:4147 length:540 start_codon:yes stop_codon:yes gene_type:complete